jgi:1,4-alpha-glucan branching enzyme
MGCDFGQSEEWAYDNSLSWHLLQYKDHYGIKDLIRDLNHLYRSEPALVLGDVDPKGFEWISAGDADSSVIAFIRKGQHPEDTILVVGHYTPISRYGYTIGVPYAGYWKEVLNSSASCYGGEGIGNLGGVETDAIAWDSHGYSLKLTLPGLSTSIFKYQGAVAD